VGKLCTRRVGGAQTGGKPLPSPTTVTIEEYSIGKKDVHKRGRGKDFREKRDRLGEADAQVGDNPTGGDSLVKTGGEGTLLKKVKSREEL